MKMGLYSVLDVVENTYSPIMCYRSERSATNALIMSVNEQNKKLKAGGLPLIRTSDLQMYCLAEFDDETGEITLLKESDEEIPIQWSSFDDINNNKEVPLN